MPIQFPLGNDNFSEIRENGDYYVDKTAFIKELLRQNFKVNRITRPRRFGKTLTMSMLEDFFEVSRDSRKDFEGLAISREKELCAEWMNQWPTLFVTLKSVEGLDYQGAFGQFRVLVSDWCKRYSFLGTSERVAEGDRVLFQKMEWQTCDDGNLQNCLYHLTRMLHDHYGKPVILLIDEYDVPLAKASEQGYYREMLNMVRTMFGKALKGNEYLKFAVVTGCLKIAKESIFTGINNLVADTITSNRFDEYIGFTEQEVQKILQDTGMQEHGEEIRFWYDGYRFGRVDVYCPWDLLNYVAQLQINEQAKPGSYWENSSGNGIIRKFIERKDLWKKAHINQDFETLLSGGYIVKPVTENLTYDTVNSSADNVWSLLYLTGYLTQAKETSGLALEEGKTALRIPNEEIRNLFNKTVKNWFEDQMSTMDKSELFQALWNLDEQKCSEILSDMIFDTISYHDYKEDFYHAFVVGVLSFEGYFVKSNDEAGEGRPDIVLRDQRRGKAMVIEIKRALTFETMEEKCRVAMEQIEERCYVKGIETEYQTVLGYGISFYGKRCMVKAKKLR